MNINKNQEGFGEWEHWRVWSHTNLWAINRERT